MIISGVLGFQNTATKELVHSSSVTSSFMIISKIISKNINTFKNIHRNCSNTVMKNRGKILFIGTPSEYYWE